MELTEQQKEIALRVAQERFVSHHGGTGDGIDFGNYAEFAERFLAALPKSESVEDFIYRFKRHVGGDGEFWLHELEDFYTEAPVAPPASEQEPAVPDLLFDGYSVLMALSDSQRARTSPENVSDTLDAVVRLLRAEAPIAQPASATIGWDAEFLAKRLGRVAKLAGVSIPERFTHGQVAEAAGTILGRIATAMEAKHASEQKPECPYPCGWENLYSLIVSNGALIVRSVDPDSVSESTWTSLSNTIEHAKELCNAPPGYLRGE